MRHEDRDIANDGNPPLAGVRSHRVPLPEEDELLQAIGLNLGCQVGVGALQCRWLSAPQLPRPVRPCPPALPVLDGHEAGKVGQPRSLPLAEGLEGRAEVAGSAVSEVMGGQMQEPPFVWDHPSEVDTPFGFGRVAEISLL